MSTIEQARNKQQTDTRGAGETTVGVPSLHCLINPSTVEFPLSSDSRAARRWRCRHRPHSLNSFRKSYTKTISKPTCAPPLGAPPAAAAAAAPPPPRPPFLPADGAFRPSPAPSPASAAAAPADAVALPPLVLVGVAPPLLFLTPPPPPPPLPLPLPLSLPPLPAADVWAGAGGDVPATLPPAKVGLQSTSLCPELTRQQGRARQQGWGTNERHHHQVEGVRQVFTASGGHAGGGRRSCCCVGSGTGLFVGDGI